MFMLLREFKIGVDAGVESRPLADVLLCPICGLPASWAWWEEKRLVLGCPKLHWWSMVFPSRLEAPVRVGVLSDVCLLPLVSESIGAVVESLVGDRWRFLLKREGRLRGVTGPMFVGVANAAERVFCEYKSLFDQEAGEAEFLASYIIDAFSYASALGSDASIPEPDELVTSVERLWEGFRKGEREKLLAGIAERRRSSSWTSSTKDLTRLLRELLEKMAEKNALVAVEFMNVLSEGDLGRVPEPLRDNLASLAGDHEHLVEALRLAVKDDEMLLGVIREVWKKHRKYMGSLAQDLLAEKYPTIMWSWKIAGRVVVGVPDGLGENFAYEFKASTIPAVVLEQARLQAQMYAALYGGPRARVHVYNVHKMATEFLEERDVDADEALSTLKGTLALYSSPHNLKKPKENWKCKSCSYRERCPAARASTT